ncbi:MAG: pyruvate kinase [Alphaproteobacteria bacterium]|nr:pyruvate kinase [Alphaproteobacteria bacterium]
MPRNTCTRILATIGPSSASEEQIGALIDAGADAFRFNFSHGTHKEHKQRLKIVRKLARQRGVHIAVVADMQGPKLRVGDFKNGSVILQEGQKFVLDMKQELGDEKRVTLPHREIFAAIKEGDELLLNDGNIVLKIISKTKESAVTQVKVGGELSGHKGVNLPNIKLPISAITDKDREDLKFALKQGVDWVCLSFVQSAQDVREARTLINGKALIISKLEKPSAIEELDEIIQLSDAIMVARGDLGVECPLQTVPVLQKRIVNACRRYARPVIIATQMLESMISKPTPTRAEVSDVANAVYDGCDAVMLSAESAAGKYPVEAVKMMDKIIAQVEADPLFFVNMRRAQEVTCCINESDSITYAANEISKVLSKAACIVTYTSSGHTTFLIARERPDIPILALTPSEKVACQLALVWGAEPVVEKTHFSSFAKFEDNAVKAALESGLAHKGDHIIITGGFPLGATGRTNILHTVLIK